ncbi:MAG: ester cyclase [Fulvimarina manganoxydans]|uniref:ester cyclase n=1 Tax=Fulvimarina manganoxydans TaxID=937218 RepID=UPI00235750E2|nr:ester cyclase [Fulvimarina manganoxydans]MCK5934538.1 ester cyclase [Fulvimarina manganoxydans]
MSQDRHTAHKALIAPLRAAMVDFSEAGVRAALARALAPEVLVHLCHPLGDLSGPDAFYDTAYGPLFAAVPDLERRDYIVMAGPSEDGSDWVGCAGSYAGRFTSAWMDIPPTRQHFHMRFHEFFRIAEGRVVEIQAIWDIPEVMMQAGAWPMAPSLGLQWHVPGPASQDGIVPGPYDEAAGQATCAHIVAMLDHMIRHPAQGGPEVMEMPRFWHERMSWYGPAGIGTARGIQGFRHRHQIPFLNAMPDRGQYPGQVTHHFFGDRNYAAVTGWPNMMQTISQGGWLGIAPANQLVTLRSLDFWRVEKGLIRENWVLVDLLHLFDQLGVDVFARMREGNKARYGFDPETGKALS